MKTRAYLLLWCMTVVLLLAFVTGCASRIEQVPSEGSQVTPQIPELQAGETPQPQPQLLERRLLVLEWPQTMREKDSDLIMLSINMDETALATPTLPIPEPGDEGTPVQIPDLYETHNVFAVARLDMVGMEADRNDIREPLRPGQPVTFYWSVRASEAGRYRGVVWLHVELVPKDGGNTEEILLLARPIEINAVTVLGMPGDLARILGMIGVFVSTVIGYPFIQKWIESWQNRKKSAGSQPPQNPQPQPNLPGEVGAPTEPAKSSDPNGKRPGSG